MFYVTIQTHEKHLNQIDTFSKQIADPELNIGESALLDNSAQKHKLSVKPKKRHSSSAHRNISAKKFTPKPGER